SESVVLIAPQPYVCSDLWPLERSTSDRLELNVVDLLAEYALCHVIVGPIRNGDHRHARTPRPDQTEYFRYFDLCSGLGMAASDKHQLRAEVAEFLNDLLNGSNLDRLVAVSQSVRLIPMFISGSTIITYIRTLFCRFAIANSP